MIPVDAREKAIARLPVPVVDVEALAEWLFRYRAPEPESAGRAWAILVSHDAAAPWLADADALLASGVVRDAADVWDEGAVAAESAIIAALKPLLGRHWIDRIAEAVEAMPSPYRSAS